MVRGDLKRPKPREPNSWLYARSQQEVADILGISRDLVKFHELKAMKKLRELIRSSPLMKDDV